MATRRAVITGLGVFSPIGLDAGSVWTALSSGQSGIRPFTLFDASTYPTPFGGELPDFNVKKYIVGKEPRKALKMMARPIEIGVACANVAMADTGIDRSKLDSTRFGVEFGSSLIPTELDDLIAASNLGYTGTPGEVDYAKWGRESIPTIQP
jgi:3-oxoacyl-[acyl-carrier-protein] synthase II